MGINTLKNLSSFEHQNFNMQMSIANCLLLEYIVNWGQILHEVKVCILHFNNISWIGSASLHFMQMANTISLTTCLFNHMVADMATNKLYLFTYLFSQSILWFTLLMWSLEVTWISHYTPHSTNGTIQWNGIQKLFLSSDKESSFPWRLCLLFKIRPKWCIQVYSS